MTETMGNTARGWILAAPASNSGKTLVSAALLRLLRREGGGITPYKVGPDYIDPGFLSAAAVAVCRNLDPWAMAPARLEQLLGASDSRFLIVRDALGEQASQVGLRAGNIMGSFIHLIDVDQAS